MPSPILDRRTFLKASGISLALPMLEAFGKVAETPPKRALFICNTLGFYPPAFYPKAPGPDYEPSDYLALLARNRNDFTVFSGLSHPDHGGEHACEMTWLTAARNPGRDGFENSISVDQLAAEKLGSVTRFPSLYLSSERGDIFRPIRFCYNALSSTLPKSGKSRSHARVGQHTTSGACGHHIVEVKGCRCWRIGFLRDGPRLRP